ncbi:hypothetical protein [Agromyces archimandritae]|uniref:Uncharacterized protein n=1 Tax=Agromyces archimandritae TaxID=2781962 RepID=A0A975FK15_9MICO|nr:hypothetical protein [Agromyces archimandritae]QTX03963.1 hypothetical protein G127AT_11695 [Agromyces archimandritae]
MRLHPVVPWWSTPAYWASPVVILAMVYVWVSILQPFPPQPSWTAYVARTTDGFMYALPIAAAAAAWTISTRMRKSTAVLRAGVRWPVRIVWEYTWPLFGACALGFISVLALQSAIALPAPPNTSAALLLVVAVVQTVTAISIGAALGMLLPAPLATGLALFGLLAWAVYPNTDPENVSWRNITGYALFGCCDSFAYAPDWKALLGPLLVGLAAIAAFLFTAGGTHRSVTAPSSAVVLSAGVIAALTIVSGTGPTGATARTPSDLVCRGTDPSICLFPEQWASSNATIIEASFRDAYRSATDHDIDIPSRVSGAILHADGRGPDSETLVGVVDTAGRDTIIKTYADAVIASSRTCPESDWAEGQLPPETISGYALAMLMGGDASGVLPDQAISVNMEVGTALSSQQVIDMLAIRSVNDAESSARGWFTAQAICADSDKDS